MTQFLGKTLLVITLILASCSEDEIGPCHDSEVQCKVLWDKMEHSTGAEKEQYRQYYLSEKHMLENCYAQNK